MLIETHAHLYSKEFAKDRPDMILRAQEAGVVRMEMPNIDHTSIDGMLELEQAHPGLCFAQMGLHPCYVQKDFEKELYVVEDWLGKRRFTAVGEIGIDLYWDKTTLAWQEEALRIQAEWALKYHLPVVIHSREAFAEAYNVLLPFAERGLKGVFHCFSGTVVEARQAVDMGFYLGLGGTLTYKNKGELPDVVASLGLDRIVLETDSPYLTPVPHRGKRNEPAYISLVAEELARLAGKTRDEVEEVTSRNALALFGPALN